MAPQMCLEFPCYMIKSNLQIFCLCWCTWLSFTIIRTGDKVRPCLLHKTNNNCFWVLELIFSFEANLVSNSNGKLKKYTSLPTNLKKKFRSIPLLISPSVFQMYFAIPANLLFGCAIPSPSMNNVDASSSPTFYYGYLYHLLHILLQKQNQDKSRPSSPLHLFHYTNLIIFMDIYIDFVIGHCFRLNL